MYGPPQDCKKKVEDGEGLRKCIRPVCGQCPGLDEYSRASVLITGEVLGRPVFFVRLKTCRLTVLSSLPSVPQNQGVNLDTKAGGLAAADARNVHRGFLCGALCFTF